MNDCFFYEKGTGLQHYEVKPRVIIDLTTGSEHVCKPIHDAYERYVSLYLLIDSDENTVGLLRTTSSSMARSATSTEELKTC